MLFSQRKGLKEAQKMAQIDSIDDDLRYGLWTALHECIWIRFHGYAGHNNITCSNLELLFKRLWHSYFKFPIDNLEQYQHEAIKRVREYFLKCQWFEVYDLIEFISKNCPDELQNDFRSFCNSVLERENSAYRFVEDELAEISSPVEIESIEEAIENSSKLSGVRKHLKASLSLLSDRNHPDYRNSIKESISAVEAISILISADQKATLGSALTVIESAGAIHPALKKSLSSLYGYTSDADGIRHAMLEEDSLTFSDAKFMLVTCTAFINYLIGKASELGLPLRRIV